MDTKLLRHQQPRNGMSAVLLRAWCVPDGVSPMVRRRSHAGGITAISPGSRSVTRGLRPHQENVYPRGVTAIRRGLRGAGDNPCCWEESETS